MPMSVIMPVTWVVRIWAAEILVMMAFCRPMVKHSTATKTRSRWRQVSWSARPPKARISSASSTRTLANRASWWRRRPQLNTTAHVMAPRTKHVIASSPKPTRRIDRSTRWSATEAVSPVMCDV